jgi:hypothetical protein
MRPPSLVLHIYFDITAPVQLLLLVSNESDTPPVSESGRSLGVSS